MKIDIKIQSEENDCFESLSFSGEGIKDILKNNPEKLLNIIEEAENRFPKKTNFSLGNVKDDGSFLLTSASVNAATNSVV